MSDFRPSTKAVGDLGSAITGLAGTIMGKLDDAEQASQYNNGQEIMRRSTNDFMLKLQSDPDWEKYPEKFAKFRSDLENQVLGAQGVVKHQGAKNALQTWWMAQRDSAEEKINQTQMNVRGSVILGTYQKNVDDLYKDTTASDKKKDQTDVQRRQERLRELTKPLVDSMLMDKASEEKMYKEGDARIESSDLINKASAVANAPGGGGAASALEFIDKQMASGKYPNIDEAGAEKIARMIDSFSKIKDAEQKRKADEHNEKIALSVQTAIEAGDYTKAKGLISTSDWVDGPTEKVSDQKWKWDQRLKEATGGDGKVPSGGDKFYEIMRMAVDPRANLAAIRSTAANWLGKQGGISIQDFNQITSSLDARENPIIKGYDKIFDTTGIDDKKLVEKLQEASALFGSWAAVNKDRPPSDMAAEAKKLREQAVSDHLPSLTSLIYPSEPAAGPSLSQQERGAKAAPAPSYPKTITDTLAKNKVSITSARKNDKGTVTYMGSDGRQYRTGTDNTVRCWDGKAWQILK